MADVAQLTLNVFDGTRRLIDNSVSLVITIRDGTQKQLINVERKGPSIPFTVPFNNNFADRYYVIAYADNHVQAGFFPVLVSKDHPTVLDLMLLPKQSAFDFTEARWENLEANHNAVFRLLSAGTSPTEAESRYEKFKQESPGSLAAFLNVTTAASEVHLPSGKAFSYFKEVVWDEERMGEDRFSSMRMLRW